MKVKVFSNPSEYILIIILVVTIILQQIVVQFRPWAFVADDSLFYLQVARNFVQNGRSTFNGITDTNGYHPLWLVTLFPMTYLVRGAWSGLRVVLILDSLLLLAGCILVYCLLKRSGLKYPWIGPAVFMASLGSLGTYLSEAHLYVVICLLFMNAWLQFGEGDINICNALILGGLLGFCVLSRLDAIFLAGCFFVNFLFRFRRFDLSAYFGISFLLVFLPYLAWNLMKFGHLTPISGAIHSTFPNISPNPLTLGAVGVGLLVISLLAIPFVSKSGKTLFNQMFLTVLAGALLQVAYTILFTGEGQRYHWYWTQLMVCASLSAGLLSDWIAGYVNEDRFSVTHRLNPLIKQSITILLLLTSALVLPAIRSLRQGDVSAQLLLAPQFLDNSLPLHQLVVVDDSPGVFALWSKQHILPLDGLMSDYRFQDALVHDGIEKTLEKYQVCYYASAGGGIAAEYLEADPFANYNTHHLRVISTLYNVEVGVLSFSPAQEVGRVWIGAPSLPYIIIWKIRPDCPSL